MKQEKGNRGRWVVRFFVAFFVIFGLVRVYFRVTDDFRIANMTYEIGYHPEWEIAPPSKEKEEEIQAILAKQYSYLGKGAQSYAFESDDGKHILKFFKFKHLKPNMFLNMVPPLGPLKTFKKQKIDKKEKNLHSVFSGYHLAYQMHQEDSGILYVHLNQTKGKYPTIHVRDKIGLSRKIHLDQVIFVVQEKAKTTRAVLADALNQGDLSLAKKRMEQIFSLYFSEYKKGIYDRDHGVMHNTGFVGDKPIHLDVGKLTRTDETYQAAFMKEDFEKVLFRMETWIKAYHSDVHPELNYVMHQARLHLGNEAT